MALNPLKPGELNFVFNYRNAYLKLPQRRLCKEQEDFIGINSF